MMEWYLNDEPLADLGITISSGTKTTHGPSSIVLKRACAHDATPLLVYGDAAVLSYRIDGGSPVVFFRGKCMTVPRYGDAGGEGQSYDIQDAWADLETTIYQESWGYGELLEEEEGVDPPARVHTRADKQVPRAIFGMDATGAEITVGQQISNAIAYAAYAGVDIAMGSVPAGEYPLQAELTNVSVAEVISMCLRFHPDWVPWIDHTPEIPVFHVTPAASMTAVAIPLDGTAKVKDFVVEDRSDLLPDAVRVVYEFAGEANVEGEPEIFRKAVIDKYPLDGPDEGPRVLVAVQSLQGMTMQTQKSPLQCRTIPDSAGHEQIKEWIKANYPHLAKVPDAHFSVTGLRREMITEPDDFPPPVNPRAERIAAVDDVTKYPRQLIRGTIEDWMRLRVGRMMVQPRIVAAGGASQASKEAIAQGTPPIPITATNGRTKIYVGVSQWAAPEQVPVGIAESVYSAIHNGVRWQGEVRLGSRDIPLVQYVGKALNLTASNNAELSTMGAPIHSVSWSLETGDAVVGFGPLPHLAPQDFLELQRILRAVKVKWWSTEERTRDQMGAEENPSSAGDSVGGFDTPANGSASGATPAPFWPVARLDGEVIKATLSKGFLNERIPGSANAAKVHLAAHNDDDFTIAVGQQLTLEVAVGKDGKVDLEASEPVAVVVGAEDAASVHFRPIAGDDRTGLAGTMKYKLAVLREGGATPAFEVFLGGSHVDHWRGIPLIDNSVEDGGSGLARTFWKIDPDTGKLLFRTLDKGDGQLRIEEAGGRAKIRGNGKGLIIRYQVEGESAQDVAEFEDGLSTTGADAPAEKTVVTIPIPALPDGWTGVIEIGDACGTFVHVITVEDGIITNYEQIPIDP